MPGQNLNWLVYSVIGFIVVVVVVAVGASIQSDSYVDEACVNATGSVFNQTANACDVSGTNGTCVGCRTGVSDSALVFKEGLTGTTKISGKFAIMASVLVLVFIIGLLGYLYMKKR